MFFKSEGEELRKTLTEREHRKGTIIAKENYERCVDKIDEILIDDIERNYYKSRSFDVLLKPVLDKFPADTPQGVIMNALLKKKKNNFNLVRFLFFISYVLIVSFLSFAIFCFDDTNYFFKDAKPLVFYFLIASFAVIKFIEYNSFVTKVFDCESSLDDLTKSHLFKKETGFFRLGIKDRIEDSDFDGLRNSAILMLHRILEIRKNRIKYIPLFCVPSFILIIASLFVFWR